VAAVGLEEKYDAVRQLIAIGKERGYLLYDEVNDSLPAEVHSSEEIDDLLTTFERNGIEIYEDAASAKAARAVEVSVEPGERDIVVKEEAHEGDSDLDLTPGSLEKTNDPVRMYLREMGTVPLLTREGEVEIAKRIERGQNRVLKAISRADHPITLSLPHLNPPICLSPSFNDRPLRTVDCCIPLAVVAPETCILPPPIVLKVQAPKMFQSPAAEISSLPATLTWSSLPVVVDAETFGHRLGSPPVRGVVAAQAASRRPPCDLNSVGGKDTMRT
jgi:hypothetical protein